MHKNAIIFVSLFLCICNPTCSVAFPHHLFFEAKVSSIAAYKLSSSTQLEFLLIKDRPRIKALRFQMDSYKYPIPKLIDSPLLDTVHYISSRFNRSLEDKIWIIPCIPM